MPDVASAPSGTHGGRAGIYADDALRIVPDDSTRLGELSRWKFGDPRLTSASEMTRAVLSTHPPFR